MDFDKLLEELSKLKISQTSMDWEEDLPKDLWDKYFTDAHVEDERLDVDKHRWYETSITVYKIGDRYLGVDSVTDLFSEMMDVSDCYHTLEFFEMKPVTTVRYVPK